MNDETAEFTKTLLGIYKMEFTIIALLLFVGLISYPIYLKINTPPTDLNDIDMVLGEVEICLAYGRKKAAISLLKKACLHSVGNQALQKKLDELTR